MTPPDGAPNPSTNRDALSTLVASRRPTLNWFSLNARSTPGRPDAAQYRTASVPYRSSRSIGVTAAPRDLDTFLWSGSSSQPEMMASRHGSAPNSRCARSTEENSQVRMISGPCGRRSIGYTRANRSGSRSQPDTSCGLSDEVAQVSKMSASPMKPPGLPRCSSAYPSGTSDAGSTGRRDSSGTSGWSWSATPSADRRYHTGIGTPKNRCRDTSQSPLSPLTQCSYRYRMCSGVQCSARPSRISCSRRAADRPPLRIYHWRLDTTSSGTSPFS